MVLALPGDCFVCFEPVVTAPTRFFPRVLFASVSLGLRGLGLPFGLFVLSVGWVPVAEVGLGLALADTLFFFAVFFAFFFSFVRALPGAIRGN